MCPMIGVVTKETTIHGEARGVSSEVLALGDGVIAGRASCGPRVVWPISFCAPGSYTSGRDSRGLDVGNANSVHVNLSDSFRGTWADRCFVP